MAIVYAQGTSNLASVTALRTASDVIQAAYDSGTLFAGQFVKAEDGAAAAMLSVLHTLSPNPARGALTVPYSLATSGAMRLRLVDVLGRTVAVLADGPQEAGDHEARLDTRVLAAGVYAVVLEAGDARATRTVTVVR